MKMIRQGDLLFIRRTEDVPEGDILTDGIVARGEATGHNHKITPGVKAALIMAAGMMYIKAAEACSIDHQEHETVTLPPGNWTVQRQREYQPDGWRQVAD